MTLEVKKCLPALTMHSSGISAQSDASPQVRGKISCSVETQAH